VKKISDDIQNMKARTEEHLQILEKAQMWERMLPVIRSLIQDRETFFKMIDELEFLLLEVNKKELRIQERLSLIESKIGL